MVNFSLNAFPSKPNDASSVLMAHRRLKPGFSVQLRSKWPLPLLLLLKQHFEGVAAVFEKRHYTIYLPARRVTQTLITLRIPTLRFAPWRKQGPEFLCKRETSFLLMPSH